MMIDLAISAAADDLLPAARQLAARLALNLNPEAAYRLHLTAEGLQLICPGCQPQWADFRRTSWQRRRDQGKQQGLVKACKPRPGQRIVDVTAGWGRDAALLASFGAAVCMVERNPVMASLLADGLARAAAQDPNPLPLSLLQADSLDYLQDLSPAGYPDLIYLDPMHPAREKSALVKKDLQWLQQWLGPDLDALSLLTLSRQRVRDRVVVKWPQKQAPLSPPTYSLPGKTVRFDVYLPDPRCHQSH